MREARVSTAYEIRVKGHVHERWSESFEGLSFGYENDGTTILAGPVADQAALHGLLRKVRDLGLTLISVMPVNIGEEIVTHSCNKNYI